MRRPTIRHATVVNARIQVVTEIATIKGRLSWERSIPEGGGGSPAEAMSLTVW